MPLYSGDYITPAEANVGRRVGDPTVRTSDSAAFTGETVIDSVTVPVVSGRTYKIRWTVAWGSTVAGDSVFSRIRVDDLAGAQLQIMRVSVVATGGAGTRWDGTVEGEYTAVSTGNKTFVGTGARATGTGNISAKAASDFPIRLYVECVAVG
ncbi:hypothetical protein [Micromonospora sp. WMMD1274]|uniref:hypothetical protein n=1 Tax=Micromonospora sp. WMMD1274 TaxID=3404116 RepID=UPI003B94F6F2